MPIPSADAVVVQKSRRDKARLRISTSEKHKQPNRGKREGSDADLLLCRKLQVRFQRICRASPTRLVTRSRSRYSSSGIAYLRLTPISSLKPPTSIFGDFVFCAAICCRSRSRDRKS